MLIFHPDCHFLSLAKPASPFYLIVAAAGTASGSLGSPYHGFMQDAISICSHPAFFVYFAEFFQVFSWITHQILPPVFPQHLFFPLNSGKLLPFCPAYPGPHAAPAETRSLSPAQHRPRRTCCPPGAWFTGLRSQISDSSHCTGRGTGESLELQGERHQIALAPLRQFIGNPDLLQIGRAHV